MAVEKKHTPDNTDLQILKTYFGFDKDENGDKECETEKLNDLSESDSPAD